MVEVITEDRPVFDDVEIKEPEDTFDGEKFIRTTVTRIERRPRTIMARLLMKRAIPFLKDRSSKAKMARKLSYGFLLSPNIQLRR